MYGVSFTKPVLTVAMEQPSYASQLLGLWDEMYKLAGSAGVPTAPLNEEPLAKDIGHPWKIVLILQCTQKFYGVEERLRTNYTRDELVAAKPEAVVQIVVELCKILDLDSKPTTEDLTSGDLEAKCLVYMTFLQDARKVIADHVELNPDASLAESAESDSTVRYHDIGSDVQPQAAGAPVCASPAGAKAKGTPSRPHTAAHGRRMGTPGRPGAGVGPALCPPPSAARATQAQTATKQAQQQMEHVEQMEALGAGAESAVPSQTYVAQLMSGVFGGLGLMSPAPQPRPSVARQAVDAQPAPVAWDVFAEVKEKNADLERQLRDARQDVVNFKTVCDGKDARVFALQSEVEAARTCSSELAAQLQAKREACAALEADRTTERTAMEVEMAGYKAQISTLQGEVQCGKEALSSALGQAAVEKEEALALAKAQAEAAMQSLRAEAQASKAILQAEIKSAAIQLRAAQATLAEREASITSLQAEVQQARDEVDSMQASVTAAAAERDSMATRLAEARASVEASLASASAELSRLKSESDAMRETVQGITAAYSKDMTALGQQLTVAVAAAQKQAEDANARFAREQSERRRLWNRVQELRGNIRVFVRVRPLLGREKEEGAVVRAPTPYEVAVAEVAGDGLSGRVATKVGHALEFDRVFSPEEGQAAVYEEVQPLVTSAMDGYHATVFAYGQTGAGKSFTMEGPSGVVGQASEEDLGVYARSLRDLFAIAATRKGDGWTYTIKASMVEIYNEKVRDLLAAGTGGGALVLPSANDSMMSVEGGAGEGEEGAGEDALNNTASSLDTTTVGGKEVDPSNLQIRPTSSTGGSVCLVGATWVEVSSAGDVAAVMAKGHAARFVRATNMNEHSSRSHCLLMVSISGSYTSPEGKCDSVAGKLTLVDLAGSERLDKSGAEGQAKTEAANINTSLFWLGNVLHKLGEVAAAAPGDRERMKVPYKESKLTYLLKDSLDRQGKVAMIAQVSPVVSSRSETVSTLQFAAKAKRVELGKAVKISGPTTSSTSSSSAAAGSSSSSAAVSNAEIAKVRAEARKEKERADRAEAESAAAAARADALAARVSTLESAAPAPLPEAVLAAKVQAAVDAAMKKATEEAANKTKTAVDAAVRRVGAEVEEKYKSEVASLKRALTSAQAKHEAEVEAVRRETRMAVEREHKRKSMAPALSNTNTVSTKAVKAGKVAGKGAGGVPAAPIAAPAVPSSDSAPISAQIPLPLSAGSSLPSVPSFVGFAPVPEEQEEMECDKENAGVSTSSSTSMPASAPDASSGEQEGVSSTPPAAAPASEKTGGSLASVARAITSSLGAVFASRLMSEEVQEQEQARGEEDSHDVADDAVSEPMQAAELVQETTAAVTEEAAPVHEDEPAAVSVTDDAAPAPAEVDEEEEHVAPGDAVWGRGSAVGLPSTTEEVQQAYVTPPAAATAAAPTVTPVAPVQRTPAVVKAAGHTPAAAGKRTPVPTAAAAGPVPGKKISAAQASALSDRLAKGRGAGSKGTPYRGGKSVSKVGGGGGHVASKEAEDEDEEQQEQQQEEDGTSTTHATPAHVKDKSLLPRHRAAMAGVPTPKPVGILKRSRAAQASSASASASATQAGEGPVVKSRKTGAAGGGRVAIKAPGDEAATDTTGKVAGQAAAPLPVPTPVTALPAPTPSAGADASPMPGMPSALIEKLKSQGAVPVGLAQYASFTRLTAGAPLPVAPVGTGMVTATLSAMGLGAAAGAAPTTTADKSVQLMSAAVALGNGGVSLFTAGMKRPGQPLGAVPAAAAVKMSRPAIAPSGGAARVRVDENTAPAPTGKGGASAQGLKAKASAGPLMPKK